MAKEKIEKEKPRGTGISKKGRRVLFIGILMYILAFVTLTMVNSDASNWAGVVSPVLFVSSFIVISLGIII